MKNNLIDILEKKHNLKVEIKADNEHVIFTTAKGWQFEVIARISNFKVVVDIFAIDPEGNKGVIGMNNPIELHDKRLFILAGNIAWENKKAKRKSIDSGIKNIMNW